VAAASGIASPAFAQTQPSLALDRFEPAPAGDRMFGVQSPFAAGSFTPHVMILGDYAHNPLVLRTKKDRTKVGSIVEHQLLLHLNGSLSLWNRLNINIDAPIAVLQSGESPEGSSQTFSSPSKVEFGDLRAGLRLRLLGDYHDIFQLAVGGYVWFPTGASGSYVSDEKVRGMPQLILGGRSDRFVWSLAGGPEIRPSQTYATVQQGTMLRWGGGFGFLLGDARHFQLGPEFSAAVTLDGTSRRNSNAEVLLDARYRIVDDLEVGIGVGPGLTRGIGTPDLRGVLMIAYTPEQKKAVPPPPPADRDKDGFIDDNDACPDEPGVGSEDPSKNGCPPPKDRDKDSIIDDKDACPDEPGVASDDTTKNGCPPDRDGDAITDAKDACPDIKGIATTDPATNGCPGDTDGDTFRDDQDACPNEKGVADPDPTKNGCPKAVRVTDQEIVILQQVQFDTNKATIKKASDGLLEEVASVFKDHPEIVKVEIQGHTDSRGTPKVNAKLSQGRAEAVRKALVKLGLDEGRLTAKGYGQSVPIADNKTDEGRQQNRRVQFKILEKVSKQPKAQ
jgi:outer membrane protein OmpA-like peptidoglycan-associated protein